MRTRRKQRQTAKNLPKPEPEGIFPGLEQLQAAEQEALDNYCLETIYRLAEREWAEIGRAYLDWLGVSHPKPSWGFGIG